MTCLRLLGSQGSKLYFISDSAVLASVCLITRSDFLTLCLFLRVSVM